MTDPAGEASEQDLDAAIAGVYRGSLEGFIAKRDALAKELRTAGRRDDANTVKGLRKPSRSAWALDAVALEDPAAVESLAGALAGAIEAQTGGGDLRAAFDHLRERVRGVSATAAQTAADDGHPVDQAGLVPALSAVVADTEAFEALRAGRLAAIPTGGGVDLLTSLPQVAPRPSKAGKTRGAAPKPPRTRLDPASHAAESGDEADTVDRGNGEQAEAETAGTESAARDEALAKARRTLLETEAAAKNAHERAAEAERALRKAEITAEVADEQLRVAERAAQAKRAGLDQARREAEAARTRKQEAEEAAAQAQADVDRQTS